MKEILICALIALFVIALVIGAMWLLPHDVTEVHGGNIYCRTTKPVMSFMWREACFQHK